MKHAPRFGLLLLGLWVAGCSSCVQDPTSDLQVTGIEVTQAVQTPTNTVGLVAQRSTTVRVTLDTGSSNPIDVSGLLSVTVDGTFITPVGGISATNGPITVPALPDRDNEDDSLYFELEAPTGIPASSDVDFFVVVSGNGQLRDGETLNLTFVETSTPTIYYVPIDYTPSGLGYPDPALIEPGVGDAFVRGIYPVDDSDPVLYQQLLAPGLGFSQDADGDGVLDALGSDGSGLLSGLNSLLGLIAFLSVSVEDTFLYGWLAGNPIAGNGLGGVGGVTAFGNTQESRHQRTFAHELGHNFGLNHNSRTLDQTGWDTDGRLDGNPAANSTSGRVKDTGKFDIMMGGRLTNNAWVDTTTYNFLLGSPIVASLQAARIRPETAGNVITIQGRFDPSGSTIEKMEPAFRFPWPRSASQERPGDRYMAEVIDEERTVYRRSFNALVAADAEQEELTYGFFEVRVPMPSQRRVAGLRIRDTNDPEQTYFRAGATKPPTLTLTAPEPGSTLGATTTVAWNIEDPDTRPAAMQLQIAYSHDGGDSWVPLLVDVEGTRDSVMVNTREIQKSDGRGVIRVFVSDGLNTHSDDVEGLSTPSAVY